MLNEQKDVGKTLEPKGGRIIKLCFGKECRIGSGVGLLQELSLFFLLGYCLVVLIFLILFLAKRVLRVYLSLL